MKTDTLSPYMTPGAEITPAPPEPDQKPAPAPRAAPKDNICEGCDLRAGQLRSINEGPYLCEGCHERAERLKRENSPEALAHKAQIAAEMEKLRARQLEDERRAPNADFYCSIDRHHGRASILSNGFLLCRSCAESLLSRFDLGGEFPLVGEAPILLLEKRVAALEAALATLQAKPARKAGA